MNIEELITKIILGSVTQQDFYAYSMNIDEVIEVFQSREVWNMMESFGFYMAHNYNQGWGIRSSLVIGMKEPQCVVVKLTGSKRAIDKEYTIAISYPV